MITTLEFENLGTLEKFSMWEGSEFKRFTVLGGHPFHVNGVADYIRLKEPSLVPYSCDLETEYHHTEYKSRILEASRRVSQTFVFTQSYEMLEAIVEALKDDREAQNNFAYVRIKWFCRAGKHLKGLSYTYDELKDKLSIKREVR
jgi:hypothetical protein